MSLFEKCGMIANRYATLEQIANDGFVEMSPGQEKFRRKIAMVLHETKCGIELCNRDTIDITEWIGYLRENKFIKLFDSANRHIIFDVSQEFFCRCECQDLTVILRPDAISLKMEIKCT